MDVDEHLRRIRRIENAHRSAWKRLVAEDLLGPECTCAQILADDERRHFKGCERRDLYPAGEVDPEIVRLRAELAEARAQRFPWTVEQVRAYAADFGATFLGGHSGEKLEAFQHGMSTVFSWLTAEARRCATATTAEPRLPLVVLDAANHRVLVDVMEERARQDAIWGGPQHDDDHTAWDWSGYVRKQLLRAERDLHGMGRAAWVKVAALAVAAIESLDRKARR